jgi:hypothetical protein
MSLLLTSIDHAELLRVRTPCEIVDGSLLVEGHTTVEVTGGTEQVQTSLSVVTLIRVVDFGLRQYEDLSAQGVPLDLSAVCLEESLLARGGRVESRQTVNLDASGSTLYVMVR